MNKVITNVIEFIDAREAPRAAIDITFVKTLRQFSDSLVDQRLRSVHSKIKKVIPIFIEDILYRCELEDNIKLMEYIIYLKVYKKQSIFNFLSKKKKDIIIKEIKDKYNVRIDYKMLQNYLNNSFEELAENLGYHIITKEWLYGIAKKIVKILN